MYKEKIKSMHNECCVHDLYFMYPSYYTYNAGCTKTYERCLCMRVRWVNMKYTIIYEWVK